MSGSVNKVILIGHCGQDPTLNRLTSGDAVCNFSIATSENWKDKNTGEKKEKTEWHRIVAFRKLAEICGQYLSKGSQIYLSGKLQTRSWEKDGATHYTTEIIADQVQFLGGGDPKPTGNQQNTGGGNVTPFPGKAQDTWGGSKAAQIPEDDDSSIPF